MLFPDLAGLLAWFELITFPLMSRRNINSGIEVSRSMVDSQWSISPFTTYHSQPYSYGDSAGLAPDFPFNPFNYYVPCHNATMELLLRRTLQRSYP